MTVLAVVGGIAALFEIVKGMYGLWQLGVRGTVQSVRRGIARATGAIPKTTLVIIPQQQRHLWWGMGTKGANEPTMQVAGRFYLTNITDHPIRVTKSKPKAYGFRWKFIPRAFEVDGHAFLRHPESDLFSSEHELFPHYPSEASAGWWIDPPIREKGEHLRGRACFVDQYGNEHWTKMLTWHYA